MTNTMNTWTIPNLSYDYEEIRRAELQTIIAEAVAKFPHLEEYAKAELEWCDSIRDLKSLAMQFESYNQPSQAQLDETARLCKLFGIEMPSPAKAYHDKKFYSSLLSELKAKEPFSAKQYDLMVEMSYCPEFPTFKAEGVTTKLTAKEYITKYLPDYTLWKESRGNDEQINALIKEYRKAGDEYRANARYSYCIQFSKEELEKEFRRMLMVNKENNEILMNSATSQARYESRQHFIDEDNEKRLLKEKENRR